MKLRLEVQKMQNLVKGIPQAFYMITAEGKVLLEFSQV